jgi:O-antigen ligase
MFGAHYRVTFGCQKMNASTFQYSQVALPASTVLTSKTSAFVEYGFYFYMFYTIMGSVFGLWINNVASAILILLFIFCLAELGSQAVTIIRLVAYPLACGVVYILIQFLVFEEPSIDTYRAFIIWMLSLFLMQALTFRANFLHRFVSVMLLLGVLALPYIRFYQYGPGAQRAGMGGAIGFGQTNAMGEWYGFCALYFFVLGLTTTKNIYRILSFLIAVGCLYVVTLTVSRGPLLAIAIAAVIALRRVLKNGFLPLLILGCVAWIVIESGIFEQTAKFYAARGTEETGRLAVWPVIIDSFLESPIVGVGHSHTGGFTESGSFVTPHNAFLYLAQTSGIVPLVLFVAYWLRAGRAALEADIEKSREAMFYVPLFAFSFLMINAGAFGFMLPWAIASCAIPLTGVFSKRLSISQVK